MYDVDSWSDRKVTRWLGKYRKLQAGAVDGTKVCVHGHYNCSTERRGPCMNHVLIVAEDRGLE